MLFFDFAVDPSCFKDWNWTLKILDGCGMHKGRFIKNYPYNWNQLVASLISSNLSEIKQSMIIDKLSKNRYLMVGCDIKYNEKEVWINNVKNNEDLKAITHSIIVDAEIADDKFKNIELLHDDTEHWCDAKGQAVIPRDPIIMANCFSRLLSFAKQYVIFVDPNFRIDFEAKHIDSKYRFLNTLKEFLKRIEHYQEPFFIIEYHFNSFKNTTKEEFLNKYVVELEKIIPTGMKVNFVAWDRKKKFGTETLHPRFILTEMGGISIDNGLDSMKGDSTKVDILVNSVYETELKNYYDEKFRFGESTERKSNSFEFVYEVPVDGKK